MAMTKKELIDLIYDRMGISKIESYKIVESFFDIIKDELIQGNDVMISGFGRWSVNKKRARIGRNPQTGGTLMIRTRKVITFRCSPMVRKELNS
ncbi:MAG: integration host factor subunit alpha [Syntrophales bacterium]|jgi:integration host factor subunit alpha